jgi:hypothetical protein
LYRGGTSLSRLVSCSYLGWDTKLPQPTIVICQPCLIKDSTSHNEPRCSRAAPRSLPCRSGGDGDGFPWAQLSQAAWRSAVCRSPGFPVGTTFASCLTKCGLPRGQSAVCRSPGFPVGTTFASCLTKCGMSQPWLPRGQSAVCRSPGFPEVGGERCAARELVATTFASSLAKGTVLLSHSLRSPG